MERKMALVALAVPAVLAMAVGCGCESKRQQSLRTTHAADRSQGDAVAPEGDQALVIPNLARLSWTPTSAGLRTNPGTVPLMRLVLEPSGIRIDDSGLISFLRERLPELDEGEEHLVPFELPLEARTQEVAWPQERSGYHVAALRDAAAELRQRAFVYLGSGSLPAAIPLGSKDQALVDRRAVLFVDQSLPYEKLARAVYSLGEAGIERVALAVEAGEGRVLLSIDLPRVCGALSEPPVPCTHLIFTSVPAGLHASAWAAATSRDGCVTMSDAAPANDAGPQATPSWHGRQLLGEGDGCPAVRRGVDGIDPVSVSRLLQEVGALTPPCPSTTVNASPGQAWQRVAEAVAALIESERRVALGADTDFSGMALDEAWQRCEGGFRPSSGFH